MFRLRLPGHPPLEPSPGLPPNWGVVDRNTLAALRAQPPGQTDMERFFDGFNPKWQTVIARGVQHRLVAKRVADRFRDLHDGADRPEVILLTGAGGEGKSTAILQVATLLMENEKQSWTCLHREAAHADLPETLFSALEKKPEHRWLVVIDEADIRAREILAATKKIKQRLDVHVLLAARHADWQRKRLVPGEWEPEARFHSVQMPSLDKADADAIVAGWCEWGGDAMGTLKGMNKAEAAASLLKYARDDAARSADGQLLGALLLTRKGEDLHEHVRRLVSGLGREPIFPGRTVTLRDIYAMTAAMHAENQLFLSRPVLARALGCSEDDLDNKALRALQKEAMLDAVEPYVLTRHRRIAEEACAVFKEDNEDVDKHYPRLAKAAREHFIACRWDETRAFPQAGDANSWSIQLSEHFVDRRAQWPIARAVAKALYEAEPTDGHRIVQYSKILRATERGTDALQIFNEAAERFRNHRGVLYEWSTVAGKDGNDHPRAVWLAARSLADIEHKLNDRDFEKQVKHSLGGMIHALRALAEKTGQNALVGGLGACGMLGLRMPDLSANDLAHFEPAVAYATSHRMPNLRSEKAIVAMSRAVVAAWEMAEADSNTLELETWLGEPDSYKYTGLLRLAKRSDAEPAKVGTPRQRK